MSEKRWRRLCLAYAWGLGILIIALGVGLAWSCWAIYRLDDGGDPFTRERIAMYFDRLAPLVYACLIGAAGGGILSWVRPCRMGISAGTASVTGKIKAVRNPSAILMRVRQRVDGLDANAIPAELGRKMERERALRRWLVVGTVVLCTAVLMPAVIWCADSTRFSVEHLNRDVVVASRVILICGVAALALAVVSVLLRELSVARELALAREVLTEVLGDGFLPDGKRVSRRATRVESPYFIWGVRGLLAAIAVIFVVLGMANGGMADVLGKAIRICTECIGLG